MKINTILIIILGIISYVVVPFLILLIKNKKLKNALSITCLVFFVAILLIGVWGKIDITKSYTQITFDFSGQWCDKTIKWNFSNISTFDLVINLVMLFPIGIFAFHYMPKLKAWQKLLLLLPIGILCGTTIELSQYILPIPRSVQLSDVVFNTISIFTGGAICWFYEFVISKLQRHKPQKNDQK